MEEYYVNMFVKLFFYILIIFALVLFVMNFVQVLYFKWYIDYFTVTDNLCLTKSWTKYEIESMRYNLYSFLYNINENYYEQIHNNYKTTFAIFISFISIFIIMLIYNFFIMYTYESGIKFPMKIYIFSIFIYILYSVVNGLIMTNFDNLVKNINEPNNYLFKYRNIYKILNAIMYISEFKDTQLEFKLDKLNQNKYTFDQIIEFNIGSYENITNTNKIKDIKIRVYEELDFVKYLVLDPKSPYFLKYFENIYIRVENVATDEYDFNENFYLDDYNNNKATFVNTINIETIKMSFQMIKNISDGLTKINRDYGNISNEIAQFLSITSDNQNYLSTIKQYYNNIKNIIDNENFKKEDAILYEEIVISLHTIEQELLKDQYSLIYKSVNAAIHNILEKSPNSKISVPDNNYIQYFLDNKNILFDVYEDKTTSYVDLINLLNSNGNFVYAYFVYFSIMFLLIAHYIYINVNGTNYAFIMLGIILSYILILWLHSGYSFVMQSK